MNITHKFVSGFPDSSNVTQIRPSNWNDTHQITVGLNEVSFAGGSPVFDCSLGDMQTLVLTGDATATFSNFDMGQTITIAIVQDDMGYHEFTWPDNVIGGFTVGSLPGGHNIQQFISLDGESLTALSYGLTDL